MLMVSPSITLASEPFQVCGHHSSGTCPDPTVESAPEPILHFASMLLVIQLFITAFSSPITISISCIISLEVSNEYFGTNGSATHWRQVSDAYKYASGVPRVPIATDLDKCLICIQAKLHHTDRSQDDS
jgi:hypothetical protein